MTKTHWHDIPPADARSISLPSVGVQGPYNEEGEECPWPWEPQQMVDVPLGMYHCGYCGAMVIAGLPHTDYGTLEQQRAADEEMKQLEEEEKNDNGTW